MLYDRKGKTGGERAPVDQVVSGILGDQGLDVPGLNWGSIGGSGKGMKASDILAQQKFLYDVGQDRNAAAQTQAKAGALANYYTSGAYRSGTDSLLSGYDTMQANSEAAINKQLADSLAGIGQSYGTAQQMTEQGYGDLINYLSANQQDPYAGVNVQNSAPVQLEAQGLLQARGALSPDVLAYQQAVSSAGQSGTDQYQNLLNVLSSLNKKGNVSRANEAQMGKNFALTNLGEQRAGYESGLKSSAQSTLTQLANQMAQKKLEAQAQADAQAQSLLETLAGLGVDVNALLNPQGQEQAPVAPPSGPNMGLSQDVMDELARRRSGF
jgi:hypothetical protein